MISKRVSILIKRASLAFDKLSNQLLTPYDLTGSQFKVLMVLYKMPANTVRQVDIEERFSMTNPTVTGLIHMLEAKNLVKKMPNPNDKRSKVLVLTDQALEKKDELLMLADHIEQQMTAKLTAEEYSQLASLLNKMLG